MHKNVANFSLLLIFTLTEIIDRKFENKRDLNIGDPFNNCERVV